MSDIQQWRRKPRESTPDVLTAARYEPGKPLAGVIGVARLAVKGRCAVAYLPSITTVSDELTDPVLLTSWCGIDPPGVQYTVVPPGDYLVWDAKYDSLDCYTEKELTEWYLQEDK